MAWIAAGVAGAAVAEVPAAGVVVTRGLVGESDRQRSHAAGGTGAEVGLRRFVDGDVVGAYQRVRPTQATDRQGDGVDADQGVAVAWVAAVTAGAAVAEVPGASVVVACGLVGEVNRQ